MNMHSVEHPKEEKPGLGSLEKGLSTCPCGKALTQRRRTDDAKLSPHHPLASRRQAFHRINHEKPSSITNRSPHPHPSLRSKKMIRESFDPGTEFKMTRTACTVKARTECQEISGEMLGNSSHRRDDGWSLGANVFALPSVTFGNGSQLSSGGNGPTTCSEDQRCEGNIFTRHCPRTLTNCCSGFRPNAPE